MSRSCKGFSLPEVMASLVILLVVSAAAFRAMQFYQKSYGSTAVRSDIHMGVRSAIELMTQEVGQAGLLNFTTRTLGAAVTGSATTQTISVSSAAYFFQGERVTVGSSTTEEETVLGTINTSTPTVDAILTLAQAASTPVKAVGVFSQGVLPTSTATQLRLFGDINGDNTLVYVTYDCDTSAGTISRSITTWTQTVTTRNTPEVILSNITTNPGSTPCFQYTTATSRGTTFVTSIAVTLTIRSSETDPLTGQAVTLTKSFLNLSPRNVNAAYNLSQAGYTTRLQNLPSNIPLS